MENHIVKVKSIQKVTPDVVRIATERPVDYSFTPGQATDVSVNKAAWRDELRPFTFTSLPALDYLEFTIKTYPERQGVTNQLLQLQENDEIILHDVFGAIAYRGEGVFIAGGAGVTPFIAILRSLAVEDAMGNNRLIFANKTRDDIILEEELNNLLGNNFINILSEEKVEGYAFGTIDANFLQANMGGPKKWVYLCGPPPMMAAVERELAALHVDTACIVKEAL